jgi:Na+/melibiose symporter-like transporter
MALGVVVAVGHWRQLIEDPIGLSVGVVGLALVVFLTYLVFGLAGYDVRTDGTATVPGGIAWLVAALAAILLVIGVFALRHASMIPRNDSAE